MASTILTKSVCGSALAPPAATGIASIPAANLPAGTYRAVCNVGYVNGAPGANEQNGRNFGLYVGGNFIDYIPAPAALVMGPPVQFDLQLDGNSAVSVGNPLAGTAGVTYVARLALDEVILPGNVQVGL